MRALIALFVLTQIVTLSDAQERRRFREGRRPGAEAKKAEVGDSAKAPKSSKLPESATTQHSLEIGGQTIEYTAIAGHTMLLDDSGRDERAELFHISYVKQGVEDNSKRPVTFVFNGGPGSSSVWLHLGVVGPRRVAFDPEGRPLPPPARLVDNQYSWLDLTDIVLIDPVGTGFSRPTEDHKQSEFSGVREDISSVGDFIYQWLGENQRWTSPKFVAGESYGTVRSMGLAEYLGRRHGMYLNGIMLISAFMGQAEFQGDFNELAYFPSLTAIAWHHGRLPDSLQQRPLVEVLEEVKQWLFDAYMPALARGAWLSKPDRRKIVDQTAHYLGLSADYVDAANMRISASRFRKQLLRDQRRTLGRYDARFMGDDSDAAGERPRADPSYAVIQGPFSAALHHYLSAELNFKMARTYEILGGVGSWDYGRQGSSSLDMSDKLARALIQNPHLRVHVCSGYYDLATPFFGFDHALARLNIPDHLRANITVSYYKAGHMMYLREASLRRMKTEIDGFVRAALESSGDPGRRLNADAGSR